MTVQARLNIAAWLRDAMSASGMNLTEIARRAGVSRTHIAALLDGTAKATTETLVSISWATGFPICPPLPAPEPAQAEAA